MLHNSQLLTTRNPALPFHSPKSLIIEFFFLAWWVVIGGVGPLMTKDFRLGKSTTNKLNQWSVGCAANIMKTCSNFMNICN